MALHRGPQRRRRWSTCSVSSVSSSGSVNSRSSVSSFARASSLSSKTDDGQSQFSLSHGSRGLPVVRPSGGKKARRKSKKDGQEKRQRDTALGALPTESDSHALRAAADALALISGDSPHPEDASLVRDTQRALQSLCELCESRTLPAEPPAIPTRNG